MAELKGRRKEVISPFDASNIQAIRNPFLKKMSAGQEIVPYMESSYASLKRKWVPLMGCKRI
jgi:hypothetical protein